MLNIKVTKNEVILIYYKVIINLLFLKTEDFFLFFIKL